MIKEEKSSLTKVSKKNSRVGRLELDGVVNEDIFIWQTVEVCGRVSYETLKFLRNPTVKKFEAIR